MASLNQKAVLTKWNHFVQGLRNHLQSDGQAYGTLVQHVLVSLAEGPIVCVGANFKRPDGRNARGALYQAMILVMDDGENELKHTHSILNVRGQNMLGTRLIGRQAGAGRSSGAGTP